MEERTDSLLHILSSAPVDEYRPVVFWSINSALEEEELRRQIGEMKAFGLGGFVYHARAGLETEYLSEEWFRLAGACLDEARRQGLRVWMYDEYGWPSGFAGGRLLREEENRACYLEYTVREDYDPAAYAVYALEGGVPRLLRAGERAAQYHTLYVRTSDAYADVLNPRVTERFLTLTHEQYYARFRESFGRELAGFFTDEPQFYRYATPFTRVAPEEYRARFGGDIKEGLLWLFLKDARGYPFRVRYYNLLSTLYCENFYRKLNDWCASHGCLLTGHSIEENAFFAQMWGSADCAVTYLYEGVPAIDNLARCSDPFLAAKNVASVAAQTGRAHILTETFGCTGYGITPRALRAIAERQYVYGVNSMCQHLYNYSLAGQGKTDHPISFGRTLPWIAGYPAFNNYFARLGWLLGASREEAPVAVITPMESIYLNYLRLDERAAMAVDAAFSEIVLALRRAGIAYHFIDEKVLAAIGRTEGGALIAGERAYRAVVLAGCVELKRGTVALLREFLAAGGTLCTMGEAPRFVDGVASDLSDLVRTGSLPRPAPIVCAQIPYTLRTFPDGGRMIFAVNDGDAPSEFAVRGSFSAVDLVRGTGDAPQERYTIPPHTSLLLEEGGRYDRPAFRAGSCETLVPEFTGGDDNCLTIEEATVTLPDGEQLSGYVYGIFERLVKRGVCGKIGVTFAFESDIACDARLTVERQPVDDLRMNGAAPVFAQSALDCNFLTAPVAVRCGRNVVTYTAQMQNTRRLRDVLFGDTPESLRNCISYHTCLEPVTIEGAFDTRGFRLLPLSPKRAGDLTQMGYENFCGKVRYRLAVRGGGRVRIRPVGDYAMCVCSVCGQTQRVLLDGEAQFDLPAGEHLCEIACFSTMRNRFGPFHCAYEEEGGVSPYFFTLRGDWTPEGENAHYVQERRLVPFGLRGVECIRG